MISEKVHRMGWKRVAVAALLTLMLATSCRADREWSAPELVEFEMNVSTSLETQYSHVIVDVFFDFPIRTLFDVMPSDVSCTFEGDDVRFETRRARFFDIREIEGHEVTLIAQYEVMGGNISIRCEDIVNAGWELAFAIHPRS